MLGAIQHQVQQHVEVKQRKRWLFALQVLILAGADRLDRVMTVGQMQGKFQMVLLPQVG
jgi:hypothetical protein